ncbi:MAG TPA: alanine racemase [Gemmatimonadota bacterium]|jgi:alanine racemase
MRTWADIRFEALAANLAALGSRLPPGGRLLLPVKANAYGHGAVVVARWAEELGVGWFGVAAAGEALELRESGVRGRILLFGPLPAERTRELRDARITPTLCSAAEARIWARDAPGAPAHLEVDTGMGRSGFGWRGADEIADVAATAGLALEGAYTHFPAADTDPAFTLAQHARFRGLLEDLGGRGLRVEIVHWSNSAALLYHPTLGGDLARPGIASYGATAAIGLPPDAPGSPGGLHLPRLQAVLSWWAPVVQVRDFLPGDTVGYGRTARVERPVRGALLAVGYGDGYPRSQAAAGWVEIRGVRCPLLGRVSMDLTTVDASAVPDVRPGDAALLLGDAAGLTADDVAARSDTISYEILTGIRARVERRTVRAMDAPAAGRRRGVDPTAARRAEPGRSVQVHRP